MSATKIDALTAAVLAHARAYYSNGWDVVIECMEAEEVAAHLAPTMTVEEAIGAVAKAEHLEAQTDRRNDQLSAGGLATVTFKLGTKKSAPDPCHLRQRWLKR